MASDTRVRMIAATVSALERQGVDGMSFTDVLRTSGAARGAIYHHFPGGKAQLVAEAAAQVGRDAQARFAELPAPDPVTVVESFLAAIEPVVQASACGGGCAVAAVTVHEGRDGSDTLRDLAAGVFASWRGQLADRLSAAGLDPAEASGLAALLLALLEGAHVMCRAAGTIDPFTEAARTITALARTRYREAGGASV